MVSPLYHHWARRDALEYPDFTFNPTDRQRILAKLKPPPEPGNADKLILALERTVSLYRGRNAFERGQAPQSRIRRQMAQLIAHIKRLDGVLHDLDWATRRALTPFLEGDEEPSLPLLSHLKPPETVHLDARLCHVHAELAVIQTAARVYLERTRAPRGGRRPLNARTCFAVDIADALQEFVPESIEITSTHDGGFENIVLVCLEAAAGEAKGDIHRIISSAVKAFHSSYRPQGVITAASPSR